MTPTKRKVAAIALAVVVLAGSVAIIAPNTTISDVVDYNDRQSPDGNEIV